MKIALITTMPPSNENRRIREEAIALGHKFTHYSFSDMEIKIENGKVDVDKLSDFDADIVIVRGILSSIKVISAIVKSLREKNIKVFDNNFLEHEYSINKVTDLIKLSLKDIAVPKTFHTRSFSRYIKIAEELGYPMIVKSTRTGKGVAVYKADSKTELESMIEGFKEQGKQAKNYILQEYIPYVFDIRALIVGSKVYAMRRIPGEGEFRANFSLGGAVELFDLDKNGHDLALKALSAINMSVGGVDILITKDGKRYILEVNHNAGFTGMEKATGENIGRVFLEHAIAQAR